MNEMLIYLFILIGIVIFCAMYLKNHKVFEGLENATSSSSPKPATSENLSGIGAPSQLYDQSLTNAIATLDTELNMTTYSAQYLQIINHTRELYKRQALKIMLKTPPVPNSPNSGIFINILSTYENALKTLDMLEEFVSSSSKTTKMGGMWN
jgi:hypothetical protein